jgi:hypothetical protein
MGYKVMRLWRVGGLVCLLGCAHATEPPSPQERSRAAADYTVTIYDNFAGAHVRVCLEGATVHELVPISDDGGHRLRGARIEGHALDTVGGRIRLGQASQATCVDYETRFGPPMLRTSEPSAIIVSQTQWLWRPDPFPSELDASVRFVLPVDGQVSLPWPSLDATYLPDESAFFTGAFGVFGLFDRQAFSVASTSVDIARLGPRPPDDEVRRWLGRAMQATASVGDRFPRDQVHFVIVPTPTDEKQVAFGMVRRGGGSSVLLLPSPNATVDQLEADWVAIHELSHLWLPALRPKDRWISEGIATYLQEVLRARCGLQSGEHAWTRLQEGFERGRRSGTGRPLASESRDMNRTGAYHRVYWAGAAFALETDVRLRENSNGNMTLLHAISDGQRVWGTEARPVEASVLLRALEEASGASFIEGLGATYALSSSFPRIAYVDSPRYREIRARIMSRADDACGLSAESSR